jgi:hypothetical protein
MDGSVSGRRDWQSPPRSERLDRVSDPTPEPRDGGSAMKERLAAIAARLDEMREDLDRRLPLMSLPGEDPARERDPAGKSRLN